MNKEVNIAKKKENYIEYKPIESHLVVKPENSLYDNDLKRYNESLDQLKILNRTLEYIRENNKYDKSGNLVFSVYAHDFECMALLGKMEYNEKNIDAENTERLTKITVEMVKAIVDKEKDERGIFGFLKKNQNK